MSRVSSRLVLAAAAAVLLAAVVGVWSVAGGSSREKTRDRVGHAADFPKAPPKVRDREAFPLCGREVLTNERGTQIRHNLKARRCLAEAHHEGRPAEFVSTAYTIEGAPITEIYRVRSDRRVERFTDESQNPYAGRPSVYAPQPGWSVQTCTGITALSPRRYRALTHDVERARRRLGLTPRQRVSAYKRRSRALARIVQ